MKTILGISIVALALFAGTAHAEAFRAQLSGEDQVPALETDALGTAVVVVNPHFVFYNLVVNHASQVVAAHIHCAPAGVNGNVGVTLFLGAPVTLNGVLARGPILGPDPNNGCGWADLDDLIDALESGDTYVNVHTLQNLGGEIRGQLE